LFNDWAFVASHTCTLGSEAAFTEAGMEANIVSGAINKKANKPVMIINNLQRF